MTPADLRGLFPALEGITWLNAAASSPTARPVYDAMKRFLDDTVATGDVHYPAWARFKDDTRARFARFINATPAEVAFTPSTSFGFHVIAQLLKARGVEEVLTLECEFPSTTLPMLYDGLTLRAVKLRSDGTAPVAELEAALTRKTGAIAVSAVQFSSGFRIDLEAVGRLCRARNLAFIVNAAQGLGHVPLDVSTLGADFLAATSHKWFMGGYGVGTLFIRQRWLDELRLPFGGWLSVPPERLFETWAGADRTEEDARSFLARGTHFRRDAPALEAGGGAWVGLYGFDAALALHEAVGVARTLAHNQALQLHLREGLRARGFRPNTPDDPHVLSGICVVPVQGSPLEVVRALLKEKQIATTPRGVGVRISTHVYNDETDVERLLHAVDELGIQPG